MLYHWLYLLNYFISRDAMPIPLKTHPPITTIITKFYFQQRLDELRINILEHESKCYQLIDDLEGIQSGKGDDHPSQTTPLVDLESPSQIPCSVPSSEQTAAIVVEQSMPIIKDEFFTTPSFIPKD